ncbi:Imm50 family immunity protein [Streptomyces sp. NPDC053427]|uniref:Imm50 family immunity protein n=1 Tax=Streptomyces sp. NPDC053427 TaxID=3365701 RepID=UPI0037D3D5B7
MNNSDEKWIGLLENPELADRFFVSAPALGGCDLSSLAIDERGKALTLRIGLDRLPEKPLPEWVKKNLNAFAFSLAFADLDDLDIDGWLYTPTQSAELRRASGGASPQRSAEKE